MKMHISSAMKGQNPFQAFLLVLSVVSWTSAQQLQRGLAAAQGRPGASALSLLHLDGEGRGATAGVSGGGVGRRTTLLAGSRQAGHQPGQHVVVQINSSPQSSLTMPARKLTTITSTSNGETDTNGVFPKGQSIIASPKGPITVQRLRVQSDNQKAPATLEEQSEDEISQEQARNAKYSFSSVVEDELSDQMVSRQETRDGLHVKGSYSYRDGYFERTVHYEADSNGYRVIGDETKAIGVGPQPNPKGTARVQSEFGAARNKYAITAADIESFGRDETQ